MDENIGRVIAKLKSAGVWDNTLLFFISDNGGPLPQTADNTPLRGGKHSTWEGGVRVPFLVCWPGHLKPGESQAVVSSLDILPTAMAAAGLPAPTAKPLDGLNILPVLRQAVAAPTRTLYWTGGGDEAGGWWAIRSGDWKLTAQKDKVGLFDLSKDVSEKDDLAAQMPEKVTALKQQMDTWLAGMPPPVGGEAKRFGLERTGPEKTKTSKADRKKK